jgi:hypothetical protein
MDYHNLTSSGYYSNDKLSNIVTLAENGIIRKKIMGFSYELIKDHLKEPSVELIKYFNF